MPQGTTFTLKLFSLMGSFDSLRSLRMTCAFHGMSRLRFAPLDMTQRSWTITLEPRVIAFPLRRLPASPKRKCNFSASYALPEARRSFHTPAMMKAACASQEVPCRRKSGQPQTS